MEEKITYAAPLKKKNRSKEQKKKIKMVCNVIIVLFSLLFLFSAVQLVIAQRAYHEVDKVNEELRQEYQPTVKPRPVPPAEENSGNPSSGGQSSADVGNSGETSSETSSEGTSSGGATVPTIPTETENESIARLKKLYPDVVGWLIMDGTNINNVFVQGKNNQEYVRANLDKDYLVSGTLFLDYTAKKDFSAFNTVIYGHNMRNGSMFGDLDYFEKKSYFDEHRTGTVCFADSTWYLDVFAFMVIKSTDTNIYNCKIKSSVDKQAFLDYVKHNARRYRDIGVTTNDVILTLSTCSYEYDGARCVLLCRATRY